jgi:hypothetical protein
MTDRPVIDHCPHCYATKAVPLAAGLMCTNPWHDQPEPQPSLASVVAKMATAVNDAQGQMLWGQQWPTVKAAQAHRAELDRQKAEHLAKLERWSTLARRALVVYLVVVLVIMATAGAVWAWRVAL